MVMSLFSYKFLAISYFLFYFRYHDLENSPDFIVLKQHYDLSISYGFKAGQHVETLLNDRFYTGHVERRSPENEDYPT